MSEQPALKADAVASFIVTIRDLVKAERERDEALRLHVEDHARIDALLIERDEALAALARVRALVRPLGVLYANGSDRYSPRSKAILDELRAALEGP